jgi:hypothetical protein
MAAGSVDTEVTRFQGSIVDSTHIPHPRTVRFAERACGRDPIQRVMAVVDRRAAARPAIGKAATLAAAFSLVMVTE